MKDAIVLEGVRRRFGRKEILRGVTGRVAAGKVVGLLGRNGEGKSTLLRILLDLLAADGGSVEVLGQRPDGSGTLRQRIGYVPERPVFHEFMTAGDVLAWRKRFFASFSAERAHKLSAKLGLDLSTRITGASKGTLGKLAWVCACAHAPELYLLDEPTSGLDALVREDVLSHLLEELQDGGKTVLVTDHRMEELSGVLDEVWVLAGGRVAVHDAEILRTQACRVTGRLMGGGEPPTLGVALPSEGPLRQWAFFDQASAQDLLSSGLLETADKAPLPMEETLRILLREEVGHAELRVP